VVEPDNVDRILLSLSIDSENLCLSRSNRYNLTNPRCRRM
jgi:hypothetical protein